MGSRKIKVHVRRKCRHCGGLMIASMQYDYMKCEKCGWTRGITVEGNYESGYFNYPRGWIKGIGCFFDKEGNGTCYQTE
jgi:hypothetical protein